MLRARRSASRLVSSSTWRISRALSWRSSSSSSLSRICLAWPALRLAIRSSSRTCSRRASLSLWAFASRLRSRSSSERRRSLSSLSRRSSDCSRARSRSSRAASSALRPRSSSSTCSLATAGAGTSPSPRSRTGSGGRGGSPAGAATWRGRCTRSTTATATAAATSAAKTISIPVSLRSGACAPVRFLSSAVWLDAARYQACLRAPSARRAHVAHGPLRPLPSGRGSALLESPRLSSCPESPALRPRSMENMPICSVFRSHGGRSDRLTRVLPHTGLRKARVEALSAPTPALRRARPASEPGLPRRPARARSRA